MDIIRKKVKALLKAGFFDIFGATLINSIITFVYGIFIIRILTKTDYGTFSYVQNVLNFGFMFCTLGGNVGILQFCSEPIGKNEKYDYSRFALKMGTVGSILVVVAMLFYTKVDDSNIPRLTLYVAEFSLLPFLYFIKEWVTANLRWQFKNREYGIVMNVHSVLNASMAILGAYLGGIQGVILGIYFAYIGSVVCGLYFLKDSVLTGISTAHSLESLRRNKFIKYSLTMCVVNALISVLFTIDLFVIGNIMKDADQIAMYKTASTIPFALNMIPNAVMTFAYPHIAMNKHDKDWMKKNIKLLYAANGVINVCIGVVLLIMAPLIISVLFGSQYAGILKVFRILIISYMLSSIFRTPSANLLAILKMTKTALCVSAATVVISVVLGILLVSRFGIIGAALGSVFTFGIVGIVSSAIIFWVVYYKKEDMQ